VPLFPIGTWNLHSSLPQITADQFWITDLLGSRSDSGCSTRWSSVNLSHLSPPSCCRALSLGLCCSWFNDLPNGHIHSTDACWRLHGLSWNSGHTRHQNTTRCSWQFPKMGTRQVDGV